MSCIPADAAIVYGTESAEAFLVGARVSFTLTDRGTLTTDADGTRHVRGAVGQSTFSGNDPRITGSEAFTFNSDWWGSALSDSAVAQWFTAVITTADGSWEGNFSGVYSTSNTDVITWWLEGTGAYDGQSMFMWTTETNTLGAGINYALIFPGAPPAKTPLPEHTIDFTPARSSHHIVSGVSAMATATQTATELSIAGWY